MYSNTHVFGVLYTAEVYSKLKCSTTFIATPAPYLVATLSFGVTEKNGACQVLGRADYASCSTLPIPTIPTYIFGDTLGHTRG
jgi:hypothetical protein